MIKGSSRSGSRPITLLRVACSLEEEEEEDHRLDGAMTTLRPVQENMNKLIRSITKKDSWVLARSAASPRDYAYMRTRTRTRRTRRTRRTTNPTQHQLKKTAKEKAEQVSSKGPNPAPCTLHPTPRAPSLRSGTLFTPKLARSRTHSSEVCVGSLTWPLIRAFACTYTQASN